MAGLSADASAGARGAGADFSAEVDDESLIGGAC
jgi:hypothetical protein